MLMTVLQPKAKALRHWYLAYALQKRKMLVWRYILTYRTVVQMRLVFVTELDRLGKNVSIYS